MQALRKLFGRATQTHRPTLKLRLEELERREVLTSVFGPPPVWVPGGLFSPGHYQQQAPLVISNVQVETVYWGQAWSAAPTRSFNPTQNMQQIDTFLNTLVNSNYMDMLNEYGVHRGSFVPRDDIAKNGPATFQADGMTPTTVTEQQIQNMLDAEIKAGRVQGPSSSMVYVVCLPPNIQSQFDVNRTFAGHHSSFTDSAGDQVYYIVAPNPLGNSIKMKGSNGTETTFQYQTELLSHEVAETVTDPDVSSGWSDRNPSDTSTYKDEIGDIPQDTLPAGQVFGLWNGYVVQKEWSNAANASVFPATGQAKWSASEPWVSEMTTLTTPNGAQSYVFGIGRDGALWSKTSAWQGWSGWHYVHSFDDGRDGSISGIVAGNDANGWRVFGIDDTDGSVWTIGARDSNWSWIGNPGWTGAQQLAMGQEANGRLDVFAVGGDQHIYEMVATGNGATGFSGSSFTSIRPYDVWYNYDIPVQSMVVTSNPANGLQTVFAISAQSWGGYVYTIEQTSKNATGGDTSWGQWHYMGGGGGNLQLATGRTTDNRLEVFTLGSNHQVYLQSQTSPDSWAGSAWTGLGGYLNQIAVGRNQDGREELFGLGRDNTPWVVMETAPDYFSPDSSWYQLGTTPFKSLAVVNSLDPFGNSFLGLAGLQANDNGVTTAWQNSQNSGWY